LFMSFKKALILFGSLILASITQAQIITTYAGNGTNGFSGDGGPATSAQLAWQIGLATDNSGNLYIADHDNNVIRIVNSVGIISTFAGNHSLGYSGDGGPAISAQLYHPARMATDNLGNLYFTDQNSELIRKINSAGIITTITGNLPPGYSGDGGLLINAQFGSISGITIDNAGNMYIADYGNHVIRKVNNAGIITTIAGNGSAGFSGDNGPATSAQLGSPYAVVFDNAGNMYIPDNGNQRIRKINPAGIITTVAGTGAPGYSGDGGPATAAEFLYPWSLSIDNSDNLYVTDAGNNVVRKINTAGIVTTFAGNGTPGYSGDGGSATAAQLNDICDAVIDNGGNVYISQRTPDYVIRKVNNCLTASISQQPDNVIICNSGNVSFSVIANNASAYYWQVNTGTGWNNLTDNLIYSGSNTDNLAITGAVPGMNNYQYRCAISNTCATIFSRPVLLTVNTATTPGISIIASSANICAETNVVFMATPSNAGANPVYQWKKNGINTGSNSNSYSDNSLSNGDIISCMLTSASTCVATNTAISNNIVMTVNVPVTPSITIATTGNNVCAGTPVTFTSTIVNGGPSPLYTWFKNGVNLFINAPTYTDNMLNNGDIIMSAFRSSLTCVTSEVNPSNEILANINPLVTPAVTIIASKTSICKDSPVLFIATPVNGGLSPIYQWEKNGIPVGTNSSIYNDNTIANGDAVSCTLASSASCLSTPIAVSNTINIAVFGDPIVTLDHSNKLCTGATKQLDAGSFISYIWDNGSTERIRPINNIGTYYVTVTDNNGCKGSDTTKITTLLPLPSDFMPLDTSICSYNSIVLIAQTGFSSYLWNTGSSLSSITISQPGLYWLEVTDNNNCRRKDTVTVFPKECMKGFYIPNAFTPNGDGKNDVFKPLLFGNVREYNFRIYNRWGSLIYQSNNPANGWDGSYKGFMQDTNVFVWVCTYRFDGEKRQIQKGTVVIVR
jgi:gliding motility-associated-like protein